MARIGIFSDTHGSIYNLESMLLKIGNLDSMFHLGDVVSDAPGIANQLNTGFVAVRGNCDPWSDHPTEKIVSWDSHRILLVHGHLYPSKLNLYYKAKSQNCDIVCYGHSHIASIENEDGILFINPGSLSRPRGGQKPSCAILVLEREAVRAEIIHI